ncbi:S24 family peptidase [Aeromonas veronii]|uniref:LexA family protein n=1 Tax=Aeromonas veronii TaxID=654 RepID=UPI0021D8D2FE|nr:S24 family peptidase [Aeromonas veronii]UYB71560.1 S24 family peptidase [Aeromonas veronii]
MQPRSSEMARYEADKIAFAQRLNEALEQKGFAERGRAGKLQSLLRDPPSIVAIRKWLSGDNLPEVKRLGEISQIIERSVQWMLTGEDSNIEGFSDQVGLVPVISWVQAGNFCSNGDIPLPQEVEERIPSPVRVGYRAYAVRVKGDSMVSREGGRSYPEGTVLIVDPDVEPEAGRRVIARIGDETTFKELVRDAGQWFLKPLNPQYKMIPVTEEVAICGVVRCAVQEE